MGEYLRRNKKTVDQLTQDEANYLERLGYKLTSDSEATTSQRISEAIQLISYANLFLEEVGQNNAKLLTRGVDQGTRNQALGVVNSDLLQLRSAETFDKLSRLKNNLEADLAKFRLSLASQQNIHSINQEVSRVFSASSSSPVDNVLRNNILTYLQAELGTAVRLTLLNDQDVVKIQQIMQKLFKLDQDLQSEVLHRGGVMRLERALAIQKARDEKKSPIPVQQVTPPKEPPAIKQTKEPPPLQVVRPTVPPESPKTIEEREARRTEVLNKRLQEAILTHGRAWLEMIGRTDLEPKEISQENLTFLERMISEIAKFTQGVDVIEQLRVVRAELKNREKTIEELKLELGNLQRIIRDGLYG